MTIAHLGLQVDSGQVSAATPALEKMTAAARGAETAAMQLGRAAGVEEAATSRAATAARVHTAALQAQAAAARLAANNTRMLGFQLNDIAVSLASGMSPGLVLMQQGSQIAQLGFANVVRSLGSMARAFAPVAAAAGVAALAIAGVTNEINKTSAVSVSMIDVMTGAFGLLADSVLAELNPIIGWFGEMWDLITPHIADGVNMLIGSFVLAYDDIKTMWAMLPAALGDIAIRTLNGVIATVDTFLDKNRLKIAEFMAQIAPALGPLGIQMNAAAARLAVSPIRLGQMDNPYAGGETDYKAQMAQNRLNAFGTDWVGEIGKRAQKSALARAAEEADKATKGVKSLASEGFGKLMGMTNSFADATRSAFSNLGTGIADAFKKGGDVGMNILSMLLDRVGQLGESLLNQGLNSLFDIGLSAIMGGIGGGLGTGAIGRGVYGGNTGFFPAFPGMADGGTVARSGLSWVGENGKELMHVPKGAEVIPHRQSMAIANDNASGGNLHVTVGVEVINGNLVPTIARVTGEVAGRMIDQRAPLAVAKAQQNRKFG